MTNRLLPEDAVKALVQGKIDAILNRITDGRADYSLGMCQISALQTVLGGLKWIESDDQRRMRVGGEFPLIEEAR